MPNPIASQITPPRVPFFDKRTGDISREWYRWFYNMYVVTGGLNQNVIQPDHGGTGTYVIPEDGQLLIGNSTTHVYNVADLGTGPGIASTAGPGTLSIENTGVLSATAGAGIDIDQPAGDITVTNTGVLSFSGGTTGLTPAAATTGDVTLAGTLDVDNGGTGATTPAGARANLSAAKSGANSDITSMGALTGGISAPQYLEFSGTVPGTPVPGTLWFDGSTDTLNLQQNAITQQIGEEIFVYGKASAAISGQTILQAIYKTGVVGASGVIKFAPTVAGITDTGAIIGVATEDIANNGFGRVTSFGVVHGINTTGSTYGETWVDGQDIWYDPVTGGLTKNKPSAPNQKFQIGTVINAGSGGSGSFQVLLQPGSVLGGTDSNVEFSALATNDLIQYNGTYWTNVTPAVATNSSNVLTWLSM